MKRICVLISFILFVYTISATAMESNETDDSQGQTVKLFKQIAWSKEELKQALESDPTLKDKQDENGDTLLHHLAKGGLFRSEPGIGQMLQIIFSFKPDINIFNKEGKTALHVAAYCSCEKVSDEYVLPLLLKYAVENNFKPNPADPQGWTPLHIAAGSVMRKGIRPGFPVRHFLDRKIISLIDFNVKTKDGETPLHRAIFSPLIPTGFVYGNIQLLIKAGADPAAILNDSRIDDQSKSILTKFFPKECVEVWEKGSNKIKGRKSF